MGCTASAAGAKGDGIYALNQGSGALSITTSGAVSGFGAGIEARNYGTNLTVSAANVSGGTFGVYAVNQGSGALSITTAGQVVGGARGIFARNYGTSLSINAAGASGKVEGIGGYNHGSGALTITATGTVSGGSSYGLIGKGYPSGQGVTIQAENVSGGTYGVVGLDYGPGALSITTTGDRHRIQRIGPLRLQRLRERRDREDLRSGYRLGERRLCETRRLRSGDVPGRRLVDHRGRIGDGNDRRRHRRAQLRSGWLGNFDHT